MDFLRDPLWQFVILALLTIGTIITSFIIYSFQRNYKSVSYEVVSVTEIVSLDGMFRWSIQISFEGQPVEDATMVVTRLFNSGNVPILASDFHQKMGLYFGGRARILSFTVQSAEPNYLDVELVQDNQILYLEPTLFNKGDSVTIGVVVENYDSHVVVGRIVGVESIKNLKSDSRSRDSIFFGVGLIGTSSLVSAFGMLIARILGFDGLLSVVVIVSVAIISIVFLFFVFPAWLRRFYGFTQSGSDFRRLFKR